MVIYLIDESGCYIADNLIKRGDLWLVLHLMV